MKTRSVRDRGQDLLPLFPEHSSVTPDGELVIGGVGVAGLAERFGTPAYIVDEAGLRNQARRLRDGLAARHPDSEVVFASKSFPCLAAYQLMAAEQLAIDVAGAGELVMALAANVPPERLYLHGNAKSTAELTMALQAGVGTVVVDNFDDIDRLESLATRPQRVLVRIIPGISPETHRRRRLQVRPAGRPGARGDRPDQVQRLATAGRTAPAHRVADPRHRAVRQGRGSGGRARRVRRL
jgi:diaminopimelate decarboxylase